MFATGLHSPGLPRTDGSFEIDFTAQRAPHFAGVRGRQYQKCESVCAVSLWLTPQGEELCQRVYGSRREAFKLGRVLEHVLLLESSGIDLAAFASACLSCCHFRRLHCGFHQLNRRCAW